MRAWSVVALGLGSALTLSVACGGSHSSDSNCSALLACCPATDALACGAVAQAGADASCASAVTRYCGVAWPGTGTGTGTGTGSGTGAGSGTGTGTGPSTGTGPGSGTGSGTGGSTGPTLGPKALLLYDQGALDPSSGYYLADDLYTTVPAILTTAGVQADTAATMPADLTPYRMILWDGPGASLPANTAPVGSETAQLAAWLQQGGRLVLVGDISYGLGKYSGSNEDIFVNTLLGQLGATFTIGGQCSKCSANPTSPLSAGQSSLCVLEPNCVSAGSATTWLFCPYAADERVGSGDVVLVSDTSVFNDQNSGGTQVGCAASNTHFIVDLATAPAP